MTLRTPSTTQSRQALLDLARTNERLAQNQNRATSGNRLTSPGDDPTAAATILSFGNSIQANNQFVKQVDSAISFQSSSETIVSSAIEATTRLKELAVNGASASIPELDGIRSNLLALANTQTQGKYLFAGTNTQTQPFTLSNGPSPTATYSGTTGAGTQGNIDLFVTSTTAVTTNVRGDVVFLGGKDAVPGNSKDIFQAINDLEAAYSTTPPGSTATVQAHLDSILANLNQVQADLGGRQAALLSLKDTLSGFNVTLQDLQNTQQNTDYVKVATELSQDQTLQSVTLSVLAKSNKTNLFDYLA